MRGAAVVMVVVYLTTIACANSQERAPEKKGTVPLAANAPLVIFLGDSLTAGFGLAQDEAFPALVGEMLAASGHPVRVVNAGVSGDTTGDGLARLDWLLKQGAASDRRRDWARTTRFVDKTRARPSRISRRS
jgi:acyl-CoA thioesterase-1